MDPCFANPGVSETHHVAAPPAALADAVRAGMLTINHFGLALPEAPFGGINDLGYITEGGADAIEPDLNARYITHRQVD